MICHLSRVAVKRDASLFFFARILISGSHQRVEITAKDTKKSRTGIIPVRLSF